MTTAAAVALGLSLAGGSVAVAASSGVTTSNHATSAKATSATPNARATGQPPTGGSPPAAVGKVASVGTDTFTVTTRGDSTVTITVDSSTAYVDQGVTSVSFADVKVGEEVAVFGTDSSGTVTATRVAIGAPKVGAGRPGGKGAPAGKGSKGGKGAPGGPGGMGGPGGTG